MTYVYIASLYISTAVATRLSDLACGGIAAILLTGGTGQTTTCIPFKGIKFDWYDPSTFKSVFDADPNIDRVYLVAPQATSEQCRGVKCFILFTTSMMTNVYLLMGRKVHEYLLSLNVDYVVLRPSWVFGACNCNFLTVHLRTIKEENTIISDGKIRFTSADDIAEVVVTTSHNTNHIITSSELLSYNVAAIFTEVGRKITHTHITVEQSASSLSTCGVLHSALAKECVTSETICDAGDCEVWCDK
ncbi:hypothetical protein IW262DRAFT_1549242 [Armillaria fumosa]|nr:hypothetical protein IW262DRAFT_1549242 [Armillaria fumosa]